MSSQSTECKINRCNSIYGTSERGAFPIADFLVIYIAIKETLKQQEKGTAAVAALVDVGVGVEAQQRAEGKYIFIIESSTLQCVYFRNFAEGSSARSVSLTLLYVCMYVCM